MGGSRIAGILLVVLVAGAGTTGPGEAVTSPTETQLSLDSLRVVALPNKGQYVISEPVYLRVLLANAGTIVDWLQGIGLIPLAEYLCVEYVTGMAIAVIVALLILLPGRAVWAVWV